MNCRRVALSSVLVGAVFVLSPMRALAQQCPPGSIQESRVETDRTITLTCRCSPGFWVVNNQCMDRSSPAVQQWWNDELAMLLSGAALDGLEDAPLLQDYAIEQDWPDDALTGFLISTLQAGRGYFKRARQQLEATLDSVTNEVALAYDDLLSDRVERLKIRDQAGPFAKEAVDPEQLRGLETSKQREIIEAAVKLGQGDYDAATEKFENALGQVTPASRGEQPAPMNAETRRQVEDAVVWAGQLKSQRDSKVTTAGQLDKIRNNYTRQREQAAAERSWNLAVATGLTGQTDLAVSLIDEALPYFAENSPELARVLRRQRGELEAGTFSPGVEDAVEKAGLLAFKPTRADAILDALEYGKGNWDRSIRYLELSLAVSLPEEQAKLREALAYVQGLSAGR